MIARGGREPDLGARRIRALRGAKQPPDPWRPVGVLTEDERLPGARPPRVAPALTLLLAGAECPFTCVFCDLWRHTLDGPTPEGALAAQVRRALAGLAGSEREALAGGVLKLYNASNFFDPRAVPAADLPEIAVLARAFSRVVVECHPRLVLGPGAELWRRFSGLLDGRLEVAMGLETVHPEAFESLGKGMELGDFARAAAALRAEGVDVRAFVLVGVPRVPAEEAVEWAVRSAVHALGAGACHVALIPLRPGNGALEELSRRGEVSYPVLDDLEQALERALDLPAARAGAVVTADLWDLERLAACMACLPARRDRLRRANLTGCLDRVDRAQPCAACGVVPAVGLTGGPA